MHEYHIELEARRLTNGMIFLRGEQRKGRFPEGGTANSNHHLAVDERYSRAATRCS
jgi:hypothetical protein